MKYIKECRITEQSLIEIFTTAVIEFCIGIENYEILFLSSTFTYFKEIHHLDKYLDQLKYFYFVD